MQNDPNIRKYNKDHVKSKENQIKMQKNTWKIRDSLIKGAGYTLIPLGAGSQ